MCGGACKQESVKWKVKIQGYENLSSNAEKRTGKLGVIIPLVRRIVMAKYWTWSLMTDQANTIIEKCMEAHDFHKPLLSLKQVFLHFHSVKGKREFSVLEGC